MVKKRGKEFRHTDWRTYGRGQRVRGFKGFRDWENKLINIPRWI